MLRGYRSQLLAATLLAACGGGAAETDAGTTDATSAVVDAEPARADAGPFGTWDTPIDIVALPFTHAADTGIAPTGTVSRYRPCAPDTDEGGPEIVYRLTTAGQLVLRAAVDDVSGDAVDVDVHILSANDADSCIARDNVAAQVTVSPGTYYIVVDTWVDGSGTALVGPYQLTVSEVTGNPSDCLTSPITCTASDLPLVNGIPTEPPGVGGCPAGMALVDSFCIDRWEAALVALDSAGTASAWSPYAAPASQRVRAVSAPGLVPQGYITQVQAAAACSEAGKRLCSDSEWLRACRGAASTTFPYGNTREPGRCNDARTCHPVVQYFESTASWIWSELGHPCINQLPDGLATTGSHDMCQSADGIYDMMGNLHEWTADPAGTFRGGFYVDTEINGPGCLYATTAHNVQHWDYSTGFRCCATP